MIDRDYGYDFDYDEPKFHSRKYIRRARVAHICDSCKEIIPVGQPYVRDFWVMPGEKPSMTIRHAGDLGMCPKDIAQINAEFEAEQAQWFEAEQDQWAKWEKELEGEG